MTSRLSPSPQLGENPLYQIQPAEDERTPGVPTVQIASEERFYNEEYQPFIVGF